MGVIDAPDPKVDLLQAVRAEQIGLLYANAGFPLLTMVAVAAMLAGALVWLGTLDPVVAVVWLAAMCIQAGGRAALRAVYLRAQPPARDWRKWANRFVAGAFVGAMVWGLGSLWLLAPGRPELQMLVVMVLMAVVYGGLMGFAAYLPGFFIFFLPGILPAVGWFAMQGDALHTVVTVLLVLWIPGMAFLTRPYSAGLLQAMQLRYENTALVDELRAQTSVAEQASRAKSRFLAAASHDLRQPVHALGMFVGALRSHRLPNPSLELVDQMDASIGALDELFSSLLDISRLDAGVIERRVAPLPVQPMLARVCRELEPEAEAKGLQLVLAPSRAMVLSDPVLLERVMRNLIGNAVRHTGQGSVLVGCRRRGHRICLEVRDSGPGIAPELHEAVFEEFFQVSNPDRDRTKGLGLGLPIVRRLTGILDHPLEMESTPGKGTTFRVLAPRAAARSWSPAAAETTVGQRSGVILAIDDEQAIRAGMSELLKSWGYTVIAAADAAEAITAMAAGAKPDLVICDYRLRDGENGVDAIRQVQAAAGLDIPALLLTGDTGPENIRVAAASGYRLLHKPLSHARLRAAVGNLIRHPGAAPAAG